MCAELSWGVLSESQPGKAKAAAAEAGVKPPCSWSQTDAAFQSWPKLWQRGQSFTLHVDQSLGAGCHQENGTVEGQLSFFHSVQLPVRE